MHLNQEWALCYPSILGRDQGCTQWLSLQKSSSQAKEMMCRLSLYLHDLYRTLNISDLLKPQPTTSLLGTLFHWIQLHNFISTRFQEYQSRLLITYLSHWYPDITWDVDREIKCFPPQQTPSSCTLQLSLCSRTLKRETHMGTLNTPGHQHTYHLLKGKYCWPNMVTDIAHYVTSFRAWTNQSATCSTGLQTHATRM